MSVKFLAICCTRIRHNVTEVERVLLEALVTSLTPAVAVAIGTAVVQKRMRAAISVSSAPMELKGARLAAELGRFSLLWRAAQLSIGR